MIGMAVVTKSSNTIRVHIEMIRKSLLTATIVMNVIIVTPETQTLNP